MIARAVIGANFGDEGKGIVTDWLCSKGAGMVVRFNGGAQAGHTVVAPDGRRHVFHHVGSGALLDVPTFLSKYFVCNPLVFFAELDALKLLGVDPVVYADPQCRITTFADMFINQMEEDKRGKDRHGSVGLGINETINRSKIAELEITMGDLWHSPARLRSQLETICDKYFKWRMGAPMPVDAGPMIEHFIAGCERFAQAIHPLGIQQCPDIVFEGAQGLLLDQGNKEYYPHLTRSNTGMKNVRALMALAGIDECETYYVSRTYMTRHGAGPFPTENRFMSYPDETNVPHDYQGNLRFGMLDEYVNDRCFKDFYEHSPANANFKFVLTHCDQNEPDRDADFYSYGPCRTDIQDTKRAALPSRKRAMT